jgi:hypothetical protein
LQGGDQPFYARPKRLIITYLTAHMPDCSNMSGIPRAAVRNSPSDAACFAALRTAQSPANFAARAVAGSCVAGTLQPSPSGTARDMTFVSSAVTALAGGGARSYAIGGGGSNPGGPWLSGCTVEPQRSDVAYGGHFGSCAARTPPNLPGPIVQVGPPSLQQTQQMVYSTWPTHGAAEGSF